MVISVKAFASDHLSIEKRILIYFFFWQELREGFDKEKGNREKLLLTMAVPAGVDTIEAGYDIRSLNR